MRHTARPEPRRESLTCPVTGLIETCAISSELPAVHSELTHVSGKPGLRTNKHRRQRRFILRRALSCKVPTPKPTWTPAFTSGWSPCPLSALRFRRIHDNQLIIRSEERPWGRHGRRVGPECSRQGAKRQTARQSRSRRRADQCR